MHTTDHRLGRILLWHCSVILRCQSHAPRRGSRRRREGVLRIRSVGGAKFYEIRGGNVGSTLISVDRVSSLFQEAKS